MSIIAVIPARGGSKGIPRKNLVQLGGKSLLEYAIETAKSAPSVNRVLVSTDDLEISNFAKKLCAEVPFFRPPDLASDTAPMVGVLQHTLSWLQSEGEYVEALILLQPTSPFRTSCHIEEALHLFRIYEASSVVSVVEVPHQYNPFSLMKLGADGRLVPFFAGENTVTRRQEKPVLYARNGPVVLVCRPSKLVMGDLYGNSCIPYFMSIEDSLDIDTPTDLVLAELLLKSRQDIQ